MRPTQIRCDTVNSTSSVVRVTSRKDHVISTDVKISRDFDGRIMKWVSRDDVFDAQNAYQGEMQIAHVEEEIHIDLDDLPVNKSIERMSFYPTTAQNHFDTYCKERATILPYLCDDRVYKNKIFKVGRYHSLKLKEPFNSRETLVTMRCMETGVAMAFENTVSQVYGFQFHPESFLTQNGKHIIQKVLSA